MGSRAGDYFISLNKSGFTISAGFCIEEKIKDFSKCIMYFDTAKKAVGFQFVNGNNVKGAFKVVHTNNGASASISPRSFIKANHIDDSKYFGRKIPKKISKEGLGEIFVIDLVKQKDQDRTL